MDTISCTAAYPIQRYAEGQPITMAPLADTVGEGATDAALSALTRWVNHMTEWGRATILTQEVGPHAGTYDAVLRIALPSVEGGVSYDYLVKLAH